MNNIKLIIALAVLLTVIVFIQCISRPEKTEKLEKEETLSIPEDNKVRLSVITIDPARLDEYNEYLKEEIEASIRLEPGVLTLYAVSEKERPDRMIILEIYADEEAYRRHIETPHFKKYKEETLDMVLSLELLDVNPLIPGLKIK